MDSESQPKRNPHFIRLRSLAPFPDVLTVRPSLTVSETVGTMIRWSVLDDTDDRLPRRQHHRPCITGSNRSANRHGERDLYRPFARRNHVASTLARDGREPTAFLPMSAAKSPAKIVSTAPTSSAMPSTARQARQDQQRLPRGTLESPNGDARPEFTGLVRHRGLLCHSEGGSA